MAATSRAKLCPEITDPEKRAFLDMVPIVRMVRTRVTAKQTLQGEKIEVPLADRTVKTFLHRACSEHAPVIFEYHGGGYVFGDADTDDAFCEKLCELSGCNVVGVDYRMAPENHYPAQLDDAWEVIAWYREHAEEFSLDPERVGVTGFSAGANLAAAVAIKAVQTGQTWLKAQVLHYPFLGFTMDPEDSKEDKAQYSEDVDPVMVKGFIDNYCKPEEQYLPLVSPMYAKESDVAGMGPVLMIPAGRDKLCKHAQMYREVLEKAGVDVKFYIMPDVHHCYVEDAFNKEMYNATVFPQVKKLHNPEFPERAEEALRMTSDFFQEKM